MIFWPGRATGTWPEFPESWFRFPEPALELLLIAMASRMPFRIKSVQISPTGRGSEGAGQVCDYYTLTRPRGSSRDGRDGLLSPLKLIGVAHRPEQRIKLK